MEINPIVYVLIKKELSSRKGIVWKVYDSEEKAINACKYLNKDESEAEGKFKYVYEDWLVR